MWRIPAVKESEFCGLSKKFTFVKRIITDPYCEAFWWKGRRRKNKEEDAGNSYVRWIRPCLLSIPNVSTFI